jgi:hypothetical protein
MNSLTDLRDVVDVVIGVDNHVHAHSAAVLDTATGGVLDEITVEATAEEYAELVEFANNHAMLRAWAIEGTGGHGAGLSRHLLESSEIRPAPWWRCGPWPGAHAMLKEARELQKAIVANIRSCWVRLRPAAAQADASRSSSARGSS